MIRVSFNAQNSSLLPGMISPGDPALVDHVDGSARRRGRECLQPSTMADGFGFEGPEFRCLKLWLVNPMNYIDIIDIS